MKEASPSRTSIEVLEKWVCRCARQNIYIYIYISPKIAVKLVIRPAAARPAADCGGRGVVVQPGVRDAVGSVARGVQLTFHP
jgi:hypothetical protein